MCSLPRACGRFLFWRIFFIQTAITVFIMICEYHYLTSEDHKQLRVLQHDNLTLHHENNVSTVVLLEITLTCL